MLKSKSSKCFCQQHLSCFDLNENHFKVNVCLFAPIALHREWKCEIISGLFHCRMYQDKLASLKRQLQQLQEGNQCVFPLTLVCKFPNVNAIYRCSLSCGM